MSTRISCEATVINKQQLTPNMIRITLGGDGLQAFPTGYESGYIKLVFPPEDEHKSSSNGLENSNTHKPRMRSYTVRAFNALQAELIIDFAVHGEKGPASAWAMNAKVNDTIMISGPGPTKLVNTEADWFFLVGDMTSLPAISVNLEIMPSTAKGYAVIEILEDGDQQPLTLPENIEIYWIINPHPEKNSQALIDKVKSLPWLAGTANVWVAGEFDMMRALRSYFKQEQGVERGNIYASSYWKIGETDEGNKAAKKRDTEDA